MRGIGLVDLFDALAGRESPRRRRKAADLKVGEKFDDYLVHAPRRAVDPPPRGVAYDTSKHRSFDRPRTPRGPMPWKRTVSAPRSLSEVTESHVHAARAKSRVSSSSNSARSRSSLSLSRAAPTGLARTPTQRFYAPHEKPVSHNRPHPDPPPLPSVAPPPDPSIPATSLTEIVLSSSSNLAAHRTPAPAQRHWSPGPGHGRRSSLSSTSLTSAVLTQLAPELGLPESARHRRSPAAPAMQQSVSAPNMHEPPRPVHGAYAGLAQPSAPPATAKKKMRPPPLITPAIPQGFPAGGAFREVSPVRGRASADGYGRRISYQHTPELQHSASSPSVYLPPVTPVTPAAQGSSSQAAPTTVKKKKRPPPLATAGVAHGFAAGGMRDFTPVPDVPDVSARPAVIPISPSTSGVTVSGASGASRTGSPVPELPQAQQRQHHLQQPQSQPDRYNSPSRLSFPSKRSSSSSTLRFTDRSPSNPNSRLLETAENDPYVIEEAPSLSSLGDSDTPSMAALKSGGFPMDRTGRPLRQGNDEVSEDYFLIGGDGVFKGGGFVITKNGLLKSPGNLTRRHSMGTAVDGVPKSSNNYILVKSLAEFSRGSTLSRRNKPDSTLGAGAAGRVSLAIHRPSGRKIAVKRINVFDVEKRNQLLKELETLMCYDSRFLVRSYGAFYDGEGVVHVTLEYMDRGALSDIVEMYGKLPEQIVANITEHCLRGLMFLHDNHVLHRDFKTSNILLSRRVCRAKLSDFGLARGLNPGESRTDSYVGTVAYMSPERLAGGEYTYASDIWGLGICVLECLLGKHPFDKPQSYFDYVDAAKSDPSLLLKGASQEAVDFVRLCTGLEAKDRPTARSLLEHPWITNTPKNVTRFREWLGQIPGAHSGDVANEGVKLQKALSRADVFG